MENLNVPDDLKDKLSITTKKDDKKPKFIEKLEKTNQALVCPTCGRKAKIYKRKLRAKQCVALIHVLKWYRHSPDEPDTLDYFDINQMFLDMPNLKNDFQKLVYWDLIEFKGRFKKVGGKEVYVKEARQYRISESGIKFAQREIAIPLTAVVYNQQVKAHILKPYGTIESVLNDGGYDYEKIIDVNCNNYDL